MSNSNLDQYYEILGLNPGASPGDVKQAYRNIVKIWHPDSFPAALQNRWQRKNLNKSLKLTNT
jgi:curved DNA-binding protein CbpA